MKTIQTRTFWPVALLLLCAAVPLCAVNAGQAVPETTPAVASATRLHVFAENADSWKQTLTALEWVDMEGVTLETSDAHIYDGDGDLIVAGRDGQRMEIPITPSVEANKTALVQTLRALRAWKFWGNPNNANGVLARAVEVKLVPVQVTIKENGQRVPVANLPPVMHEGRFVLRNDGNFRVVVRNTASQTLYFAAVYFALDGSITFMQDSRGHKTGVLGPATTAGEVWTSALYRATIPTGHEKLVLFVSERPLDADIIENTVGVADVRAATPADVPAQWPAMHWSFTVTEVEVNAADAALID